jgi:hypothetical protein
MVVESAVDPVVGGGSCACCGGLVVSFCAGTGTGKGRRRRPWVVQTRRSERWLRVPALTWPDGSPIHPLRFSRWFEQHARRAGLPRIRLHDLRHSYASAALAAGVPAKVISERLGHATIAVTMDIYSHVLPGLDREAADSVARLILGSANAIAEASVNTPLASGRRRGDEQDG